MPHAAQTTLETARSANQGTTSKLPTAKPKVTIQQQQALNTNPSSTTDAATLKRQPSLRLPNTSQTALTKASRETTTPNLVVPPAAQTTLTTAEEDKINPASPRLPTPRIVAPTGGTSIPAATENGVTDAKAPGKKKVSPPTPAQLARQKYDEWLRNGAKKPRKGELLPSSTSLK